MGQDGSDAGEIRIGRNTTKISSDAISQRIAAHLQSALPKESTLTLDCLSLRPGEGGDLNTVLLCDLLVRGEPKGHWFGHCRDEGLILGNSIGDPDIASDGLVGMIGREIRIALRWMKDPKETIESLLAEIPAMAPGEDDRVAVWRPDVGGGILPTDDLNLKFQPGDKFRMQLRLRESWLARIAVIDPKGLVRAVYAPAITPKIGSGQWVTLPLDNHLAIPGVSPIGAWRSVTILEPLSSHDPRAPYPPVVGGYAKIPSILPDQSVSHRLFADLSEAWRNGELRFWRKIEVPFSLEPSR